MISSTSQSLLEKGRQRDAGASSGQSGIAPRDDLRGTTSAAQSTFARTIFPRESCGTIRGKVAPKNGAEKTHLSSTLPPLTTQELTKEVQHVVLYFPTMQVVEDTQASLRAIENVRNGESGMSLKTFVNLCRANPKARALVGPMLGYGDESDPEVVHAISVLFNQLARRDGADASEAQGVGECSRNFAGDDGDSIETGDLFEGSR